MRATRGCWMRGQEPFRVNERQIHPFAIDELGIQHGMP